MRLTLSKAEVLVSSQPKSRRIRRAAAVLLLILVAAGISILSSKRSERGFRGWMKTRQAQGERFTVAELIKDRSIDTNDCMEAIDAARAKIAVSIAKRTNAPFVSRANPPSGHRAVLWTEANLSGYDGCLLRWEDFGRELALMTNEFQKVHSVLQRPPLDPGWDYQTVSFKTPAGSFVAKRVVAQTLGNALLYELHRTNLIAAQTHLQALVSITRLHEQGLNMVNQMIRVALVGLAASATWEALQAPGWTEVQLAALQAKWEKCQTVQPLIRALEMERAVAISYFNSFRKSGTFPPFSSPTVVTNLFQLALEKYLLAPVYRLSWVREDEWFYLRNMQGNLAALREFSQHKSWKRAKPAVQRQFAEYTNRVAGYSRYRYPVTQQILPNILAVFENTVRNQTQPQLILAVIALKRHQLRYGKLPFALSELVPDFLREVPIDYADGRPIRYRINPDGTFLLYACGKNLQDDEGNPTLDAVWETPFWPGLGTR